MLSDRLTRALARVVLAFYITHLFAPVAQAMEVEQQPTHSIGMHLRDPLPQREFAQQQEFRKNLVTLAEQFKKQEGLTDLLTLAESLALKESLNFKKRALREEAVKLNPTDLTTSTEPSEKKLTFKEIVASRKKELLGKEAPRLSSSALTVPTVPSRIRTPFQEALALRKKELLEKESARLNSPVMIAPIETSVKKAPVQEIIPQLHLPTLSIKLDHLSRESKGDAYRLSIDQTRHFGSKNIKTDHKWEQEFSLNGLDTSSPINHPWMRYLRLHLSESGTLTAQSLMAFSITETSGFYQGYNYCFQLAGGLHLNNLMTDGQIDVQGAHRISAEGEVYGQEGIFLKAKQEIKTRSTDPKHPTLVHSKKRITLKSSYLDNENSHIKAPVIEGALGRKGQRGPSLDNTNGIIEAVDLLSLPMATEVFNERGTLKATFGKTKVSTSESFFNKKGFVGGKSGLDLTVEGKLQNPGGKLRSDGTVTVKAHSWSHSHGAEAWAKNLNIIHTHLSSDETSRLGAEDLFQFSLPQTQQALIYPIRTLGHLEVERDGECSAPLHLMADLLALKGLKVRVPSAPLLMGVEKETHSPVKLQTKKGYLELNSKSLDLIKAQLFSKTGMRWEVQEKQVHIGRGVVKNVPIVTTYKAPSSLRPLYIRRQTYQAHPLHPELFENASYTIQGNEVVDTFPYPFSLSNGTMVITEGPFTALTPEGILINQAELQTRNLDIVTEAPVRNEGGNMMIHGNVHIHPSKENLHTHSLLQNILLTRNDILWGGTSARGGTHAWNDFKFNHPSSHRGVITIGGNLQVGTLEDLGGLVYIQGKFSGIVKGANFVPSQNTSHHWYNEHLAYINPYIQEKFLSEVTIGEALIEQKAQSSPPKVEDRQLEGVIQSKFIFISFDGKLQVGKIANYHRPPTPPFEQLKMFMDVNRPTALFKDHLGSSDPWIHHPIFPLSYNMDLAPPVVMTPEGLRLLKPTEKLLFHPLEEVGDLPRVLNAQLKRGCLDWENTNTQETYRLGRQKAYNLYQKLFAPMALEKAPTHDAALSGTMPAANNTSALSTTVNHLSEEEQEQLKFMVLYYASEYEGQTAYLPVSWVSSRYDNPRVRNPDGGIFGDVVIFKGVNEGAILHNLSTIHGENLLGINVTRTILERQSHRFITYHTNITTQKGSWWRDDKMDTQIVAIQHEIPQPNTGNLSTGPNGQLSHKGGMDISGGSISVGKRGITADMTHLSVIPTVKTTLGQSHSEAGGTSVTQYFPIYDVQPVSITSEGGIKGRIDKLSLTATHMIAFDKDIHLWGKEADLLAHRQVQHLGATVTQEGRAITVTQKCKEFALPSMLKGVNCNVLLSYEDRLHGEAMQFFGKIIDLESKDLDIESLLMRIITQSTSTTQSKFSKLTTDIYQESPEVAQSLFVGDEVHFRGGQAKIGGAYIKAGKLFDHTKMGLALRSIIKQYYYRQETKSRQPMAHSEVGKEGGQDVRIPTTVDADAIIRLPEGHVLLTDQTIRRVLKIPGEDNACGFASILWHLSGFDPLNAREIGVELLLKHLNSSTLQAKICTLIAPEIMEWALIDSVELASFPEANIQVPRLRQAQEDLTQASRNVNSALNLKVSLSAEDLLVLLNDKAKDFESSIPNASLTFATLRLAHEKLESAKAEIVAWASDPGIVSEYIQKIIAQPGHMLGYGSGHDGSTGTMDALALIADVNLHVYREDEGQNILVHAYESRRHAPVVELLHTPYSPKESMIPNHFNRLEPYDPNLDTGKMQFVDTVIDEEVTKIIGAYEKAQIELTNWSRGWAEHHQIIPPEAMIVVALAITLATQGACANFLAPMLKGITAASGMQLSAMGVAMVNAGFTTVCSNLATSTLATGDLVQVGKDLTSKNSIRSIGISMLSAGLCHQIGSVLDIDTNPSLKEILKPKAGKPIFMDFLKSQALKSGVNAGLNVTIGEESVSEAMKKALKEAPLNAVAAWAAYNIGDAGFQGKLTPEEQDVMHSIVGAALGAAQNPDKLLAGAATGAANAFVAARASKIAFEDREGIKNEAEANLREQGLPITKVTMDNATSDILHQKTAITQLLAASATALITRDAGLTSTGISVATNVVENNCIPSTMKSIPYSAIDPEAKLPEDFWDKLGTEEREVKRRKPGAHARHEKHLAGLIEETVKALNNPNLTTMQRIKLQHSLNNLWKAQAGAQSVRAMKTFSERDIQVLRYFKTYIEQGTSQLMGQSLSNLDDPTLPTWQQASSFVNWLMYQNIGLGASLLPATNGEVGLTVLPWFKSAQAARVLHSLNPAKLFQVIGRAGKVNILPAQELKLLPAPKMVKHHIFPQQFGKFFESKGINIHDHTISIGETMHLRGLHGAGNTSMPGRWNQKWRQFIESNYDASSKDIYQFAGKLLDDYNLNHVTIQRYKR